MAFEFEIQARNGTVKITVGSGGAGSGGDPVVIGPIVVDGSAPESGVQSLTDQGGESPGGPTGHAGGGSPGGKGGHSGGGSPGGKGGHSGGGSPGGKGGHSCGGSPGGPTGHTGGG